MTREIDIPKAALLGAFASAIVGLYALAAAGPVGPLPIAALLAAVALGAWRARRGVEVAREAEGGTIRTGFLTFLFAAIVIPLHGFATGSWVLGAIDLVVILQANRLFALSRGRAIGQVLLLGLLMLLGAAVLTLNMSFLGAVFLFCLTGTWTSVFLTLLDPEARGADRRVPRRFAGTVIVAGFAMFALTCSLFALLPRMRFQAFTQGFLQTEGVSGFSEEVTIGDIGSVMQDRSPVMRVELSGAKVDPQNLYWRGIALDRYRAAHWSVSDPAETQLRLTRRGDGNYYSVRRGNGRPLVVQHITLEPIDVSVLFGLPDIERVYDDLPFLARNTTDSLVFRASAFGRTKYHVESAVRGDEDVARAGLAASVPPDDEAARYVQIPDAIKEAILPLARELAGEGSDFRKARRIEAAMQTWSYSLKTDLSTRPDPVESFLLDGKRGWCEQYSSGMVLLLRSIGIPARMANGFHGGEPNEYGGYWLVRKSDAHSWVEVPFGAEGWVTFDPTPGSGDGARARRGNRFQQLWDFARQVWSQRIVTYDIFDQFTLVSAAGDRAQNFTEDLQRRVRNLSFSSLKVPAGILLVCLGLVSGGRALRRRRRFAPGRMRSVEEAEAWWRGVERSLARKGFVRARGETPRELAARAAVREWADLYYAVRFSGRAASREEREAMDRILKNL